MKQANPILLLAAIISFSCNSTLNKIFSEKKTPHEKYAEKLEDKDLDDTPEGRLWMAASKKALEAPHTIQLPYRQNGYFQQDKPRSLGLQFHAKQGERLSFTFNKKNTGKFVLYADLFKTGDIYADPLLSADTGNLHLGFDVEETGDYILRLQPELFNSGEYSLSISISPSLGFPVSGKASIGSYWGDQRDGGKRSHEGVDIFAAKRTPAIAAADGYITGVKEGGIGGKTVWLRPAGKNYTLYYAHLDKQLVTEGQLIKKGETLGLVGNTGNAKYTAAHLHFGIYTYSGAVDPLPFVDRSVKTAAEVPARSLTGLLKLAKSKKTGNLLLKANTELMPLAMTSKGYIAELPDGNLIQVGFNDVTMVKQANELARMPRPLSKKP